MKYRCSLDKSSMPTYLLHNVPCLLAGWAGIDKRLCHLLHSTFGMKVLTVGARLDSSLEQCWKCVRFSSEPKYSKMSCSSRQTIFSHILSRSFASFSFLSKSGSMFGPRHPSTTFLWLAGRTEFLWCIICTYHYRQKRRIYSWGDQRGGALHEL
jgi:hypothetical protein